MLPDEAPLETQNAAASSASADPTAAAMPTPVPKGAEIEASASRVPGPRRLVYFPAFRFVFDNPDWFTTVVFTSVIGFLPILGQIAHIGFYYDVVEALHRQPHVPYPKFEFRRFGDYCTRGVWPYVLAMMVGMLVYFFAWLPTQLTLQFGFIFLISNTQMGTLILGIVAPVVLTGALFILVGVTVVTSPFMLRAGLAQDFRQIFRFDWCQGYLRRMWADEVLATLFLLASSLALISLGCCVFVYGAFAAGAVVSIASAHIRWQLYAIYLERGGEPIPLHPLPAEEPPVQVTMSPRGNSGH
jgi:uncharacterized protein DUF4013